MTQLLDKSWSVGSLNEREVCPPVAGPGRIERPTHPAMPRLQTGRLHFAPAPVEEAGRPAAPAPRTDRPKVDRHKTDWIERAFEAGWVGLLAACAAECAWRLL